MGRLDLPDKVRDEDRDEDANPQMSDIPLATYVSHALTGAAFTARMFWEQPDLDPDAKRFAQWAEGEFLRIARNDVGERDLIG